jgi:hypothetical protein
MACSAESRAEVWREEALVRNAQVRDLEQRAAVAESELAQAQADLALLRARMGWLADDPRSVEDAMLEFVETAVKRTVGDWRINAPHAVASRHLQTNLRLVIRAAFAVEENEDGRSNGE